MLFPFYRVLPLSISTTVRVQLGPLQVCQGLDMIISFSKLNGPSKYTHALFVPFSFPRLLSLSFSTADCESGECSWGHCMSGFGYDHLKVDRAMQVQSVACLGVGWVETPANFEIFCKISPF